MTDNHETRREPRKHSNLGRAAALGFGLIGVLIALALAVGPAVSGAPNPSAHNASVQLEEPSQVRATPTAAPAERPLVDTDDLPAVDKLSRAFAAVARKLEPAVVNIFTEGTEPAQRPPSGTPLDDFFERFFRDQPEGQRRRSLGSGVIVDPRGYVITNNHVIENADEIEVRFSDQTRYQAEIIGTDPATDLAVLRIDADRTFAYVDFGSSENTMVGEWVLAMGNPFGFGHTVTAGIVSAKGRLIGQGNYDNFIQTDAAINPGNSGGPLVNMHGEIIGINSNIISNSGGNMGIGFAIPSDMTRKIYDQLISVGKVTRGWLGVSIQNLTPELARSFGLSGQKGAIISEILEPDGPAGKAGLKAGDIIVELNGVSIESNNHLVHIVADVRPDETVPVKFYRDGELRTTEVTMALRTIDANLAPEPPTEDRGRLGISGQNLSNELARELGASSAAGVVLMDVDQDGPGEDAGLRRGDIIIEANRQPVRNVDDLQRLMGEVPAGGDLLLRIERIISGQQSSFLWIPVRLE